MVDKKTIKNKKPKIVIRLIGKIFLFWIVTSIILRIFANQLIFRTEFSKGSVKSSAKYAEIYLQYDKKNQIYAIENFDKKSDLVILFLHGNAGKIGRIADDLFRNYNFLIPAYPGYHKSAGKPSEKSLYKTLDISMQYLKKRGFEEKNIIVFGASLGGAPALYAATDYPNLKEVLIVGTFDSIKSVCQDSYYIFCIFSGDLFNNINLAKKTKVNIRQFHSTEDEVVNFDSGKNLFKKINSKHKKFYPIKGSHGGFSASKLISTLN